MLKSHFCTKSDPRPVGPITEAMLPDDHVRRLAVCPGCGGQKSSGCVVCWDCFKHRTDITPLKYYGGSLVDWLNQHEIGLLVPVDQV